MGETRCVGKGRGIECDPCGICVDSKIAAPDEVAVGFWIEFLPAVRLAENSDSVIPTCKSDIRIERDGGNKDKGNR